MTIKQWGPPEGSGSSFREERTAADALRRHGQGTRCEAQKQAGMTSKYPPRDPALLLSASCKSLHIPRIQEVQLASQR